MNRDGPDVLDGDDDSRRAGASASNDARDTGTDPYEVPPDATAFACPRCGRPFARERHRDLHLGADHRDLDDDERAAYEDAREAETDDLRRFRIVSLGTLVLLYFGFLLLYAVAA
ncbi:DUF7410 domain-containing protein [Halobaculum saliterrae]|uniref:DUF7410 domain-containing protein n=1 Tax=Halobaculum saliterrae TaxID=2073113 RepID=UPI00135841D9|nr:C2H2-type zinc finger protein [Halobaculum saliterrae]